MNKQLVDIVLPCYNPIKGWVNTIIQSYQQLNSALPHVTWHIILVNDGSSTTISPNEINRLQNNIPKFTYINNLVNQGKGHALRTGVQHAQAPICIYTDVDFPYTLNSVVSVYQLLAQEQADVVIGIKNKAYYQNVPLVRRIVSKTLKQLIKWCLRISITDTQCGLKGFNTRGKSIFLQTTIKRYLFDLEFVFLTDQKQDTSMKAVEVTLKDGVVFSTLNWKILRTEGQNFAQILWRSWFKK